MHHAVLAQDYGGGGKGTSTLSFDPPSLTIHQRASASAKVMVKLASGQTWGTQLDAAALPTGVNVTFDPATGDPPFTSIMTVKATSAAPGVYMIRVRATGDDPSTPVQYKVTIQRSAYGY
jgi:hypothetical protein